MIKRLMVFIGILTISACGFQPLYVQRTGGTFYYDGKFDTTISEEMAQIKVLPIKERFGQQVRNNLLDLLTPKGVPSKAKYRLKAELTDRTVTQQAMRNDVTATNERIRYKIDYKLMHENEVLISGDSIAFVSYDILENPYSTTMSQKKAEDDAAKIIADDIALRIGAYFHAQTGDNK